MYISLATIKTHLRLDPEADSDTDAYLEGLYYAAADYCEQYLGQALPVVPAQSCSITLDGTTFAGIGWLPADVSGQTASVTGAAAGAYGAGTDARPMPTSGIVWVSSKDMAFSGTGIEAGAYLVIVAYDASNDLIGFLYFGTNGTYQAAGVGTSPFLGPLTGLTGGTIGVGHDGEIYAYDRGAGAIVKASDINPAFAGIFASAVTLKAGVLIDSSTAVTASVTVVTSQADMVDLAGIAGTGEDWCGNAIEATGLIPSVRAAMLLIIGDLYENREAQTVGQSYSENETVANLLHFHRVGLGI